jgi:mRNA interferase MazF
MFDRGDLLLVPFPFTDLSATKRRPILVLTKADAYGDFIALPITSRPQLKHAVPLTTSDLLRGSLPAPSWIRTDRVFTLNTSLAVKSFGHVSSQIVDAAAAQLCSLVDPRSIPGQQESRYESLHLRRSRYRPVDRSLRPRASFVAREPHLSAVRDRGLTLRDAAGPCICGRRELG